MGFWDLLTPKKAFVTTGMPKKNTTGIDKNIIAGRVISTPIDDIVKVVEYVTTDQEKEGRELGIKKAAEIYKPVMADLKRKLARLKEMLDAENQDFEAHSRALRESVEFYALEIDKLKSKIEKMKQKNKSQAVFIDNSLATGQLGGGILYGAMISGGGLGIAEYLDKKMDKKRQYYFKVELEHQTEVWQGKVKELKSEISAVVKEIRASARDDKDALKKLQTIHDKAVDEYELLKEQYSAFKQVM